ncbi:MAG: ribonuclease Z [Nitrospirae bacterium]|nr:ribonuclease Z [Nitrospirota bacterium]MCL5238120.1 ribonuclease Z [Nitrospirota bacterium]
MKPTFHADPVNGPFEDPCVYIRIMREKRALLFDLGDLGKLGLGSLMKITDAFVTHTHIDHFIGFDFILRGILRRDVPLRIFGPENIIGCVEGKLKGYTWNLIKDYPLKIEAFAIRDNRIAHASFHAGNNFTRFDHPEAEFQGTILRDSFFNIKGLVLSHQIPVMAYSLEEKFHININKAALSDMELPVGPWLSDLKKAVRELASENTIFEVSGRQLSLQELMRIVTITRGQKISYVTDISPTEENMAKIIPFVSGSDLLFCEAYFLDRDKDRAFERRHLTASLAGRIAKEAQVGGLELMHFSPKYRQCAEELYQEAMREFKGERIIANPQK